jgi:Fic-DOC domain mobile mystery protein B
MEPSADPTDGATPVDEDEAAHLIPAHIVTRAELNEAEEANIARAYAWAVLALRRRALDEAFVYELHRRMFRDVWRWAGEVRKSNKNIGIDKFQIRMAIRETMTDLDTWGTAGTYSAEEAAVRLHHRMVWIHPFENGNGRHARLLADLYLFRAGRPPLD